MLVKLIKNGNIKPFSVDKEGQTPLHIAVDYDFSVETIDDLVKLGCDVNFQNTDGTTPLHSAMYNENTEIFKKLIALGA